MDTRTGEVMEREELKKLMGEVDFNQYAKEVDPSKLLPEKRVALERFGVTTIGRNEKCPCGSDKKFKKCCMASIKTEARESTKPTPEEFYGEE